MSMKTTRSAKADEVQRTWYVLDATDLVVGRAASQVAAIIRGKTKPTFTPHADTGDFVIVINADKAVFTGKKTQDKRYYKFSGYPGGLSSATAGELLANNPELLWKRAVWGMLPKNRLGRELIKKLKVYAGPSHPHVAQAPQELKLGGAN